MKLQGEFLFQSFEEALSFVSAPTNYEKSKGISIMKQEIMLDKKDFKIINRITSDNQISLIVFFKNSTKYDIWKFWIPSKEQFDYLFDLIYFYRKIDSYNLNKNEGGVKV